MTLFSGLNSAVSGLLAGANRFQNSANNVANLESRSGPNPTRPGEVVDDADGTFRPTDVTAQSSQFGGVTTSTQLRDPSSIQRFDPTAPDADENGTVFRGNVPLEREVTEQIGAQRQFEANLAVVRAADELLQSTIDIKS